MQRSVEGLRFSKNMKASCRWMPACEHAWGMSVSWESCAPCHVLCFIWTQHCHHNPHKHILFSSPVHVVHTWGLLAAHLASMYKRQPARLESLCCSLLVSFAELVSHCFYRVVKDRSEKLLNIQKCGEKWTSKASITANLAFLELFYLNSLTHCYRQPDSPPKCPEKLFPSVSWWLLWFLPLWHQCL